MRAKEREGVLGRWRVTDSWGAALPLHGAGNLLLKQSEERCTTCEDVGRFNEAAAAVVALI